MSDSSSESATTAIVAVNEETIKQAASVSTATAGLIIGGPVFAVLALVAGNYVAQQDSEVGEVTRGLGKLSLDIINFLLKVNTKYDLSTKATAAASDAVDKLKEQDDNGALTKVEDVLSDASSKFAALNSEYDLVEKGKQAIAYAGELSNKAIDKSIELNDEYKITDKVVDSVKSAVSKASDAAKNQAAGVVK